eukprot:2770067-Karenia_brevis.AAC.1
MVPRPRPSPPPVLWGPGGSVQKNARVPRWQQLAKSAEQKTAAAAKQGQGPGAWGLGPCELSGCARY